jgi:Leu/Phe-tRNA-protein transferase
LEFYDRNDRSIKSLVELGAKGHFPLFDSNWLSEFYNVTPKKLTGHEKVEAKKLLKRVSKHRSLERKKTVILSMKESERHLVLKAFFKMVENKILDEKPQLQ